MRKNCYHCPDRHPGCHDTCESYQAWKAEEQAMKDKIKTAKRAFCDIDSYQRSTADRLRRKK